MKIRVIICIICMLVLCSCADKNVHTEPQTWYDQATTNEITETQQPQEPIKNGCYSGVLEKEYGFGRLLAENFSSMYGAYDSMNEGTRITTIVQGSNSFQFKAGGLFYASITGSDFEGPGGVRCGMNLFEAIPLILPEEASKFDYQSEEFQSLSGSSTYDELYGMSLSEEYAVFYRLTVENATPESTYVLSICNLTDAGREEISFYFSKDRILTAYSMQQVR